MDLEVKAGETHQKGPREAQGQDPEGRPKAVPPGLGDPEEEARPLLKALGVEVYEVGEAPHLAHAVKLGGNFLIAGMLEALAEAYVLVEKNGVRREAFYEVVRGFFRSPVYEAYGRILLERRFSPPGFKLRLGLKDVRLIHQAADTTQTPLPLGHLLLDRFLEGVARGMGEEDWAAVLRLAEAQAGLEG